MSPDRIGPGRPFSSADVAWTEFSEAPRFGLRYRHLSLAALGKNYRVGVAIEELEPGMQSAPAHYHMLEEEHVYVLEGALTARIGAGEHEMKAGDYVCFPAGQKAGHCLINTGGATCRYVIVGERNPNEVVVYTDSRKVLVRSLGRRAIFDLGATRGYWDGEATGLPAGEIPPSDAAEMPPGGAGRSPSADHLGRGGMAHRGSSRKQAVRRPFETSHRSCRRSGLPRRRAGRRAFARHAAGAHALPHARGGARADPRRAR